MVSSIIKIISDKIKSTAKFHESKKMIFKNKSGENIENVLTKVTNLESFIEYIVQKRKKTNQKARYRLGQQRKDRK